MFIFLGGQMMRTIWVLYGIAIVIVGVRLYTQLKVTRQLGLGDALMTLSVVDYSLALNTQRSILTS